MGYARNHEKNCNQMIVHKLWICVKKSTRTMVMLWTSGLQYWLGRNSSVSELYYYRVVQLFSYLLVIVEQHYYNIKI